MPINTDYRNPISAFAADKYGRNLKADDDKEGGDKKTDDKKTDDKKTDGTGEIIDAVFEDSNDKVTMDDFLMLMVAQLKNQDFMNPMDDTQYITQLAQISSMQQMEEMNYNSKSTYVASLVGKTASAAKFNVKGELVKKEGVIDRISLLDGEFVVYVDGEAFDMNEIMEIKTEAASDNKDDSDKNNNDDEGKGGDGDDGGDTKKV